MASSVAKTQKKNPANQRSQIHDGGFTRVPHAIVRRLCEISDGALRVALVVADQTIGWNKEEARLTIPDFAFLGGLSERTAKDGIKEALEGGIIARRPVVQGQPRRGYLYRLSSQRVETQDTETSTQIIGQNLPDTSNTKGIKSNEFAIGEETGVFSPSEIVWKQRVSEFIAGNAEDHVTMLRKERQRNKRLHYQKNKKGQ